MSCVAGAARPGRRGRRSYSFYTRFLVFGSVRMRRTSERRLCRLVVLPPGWWPMGNKKHITHVWRIMRYDLDDLVCEHHRAMDLEPDSDEAELKSTPRQPESTPSQPQRTPSQTKQIQGQPKALPSQLPVNPSHFQVTPHQILSVCAPVESLCALSHRIDVSIDFSHCKLDFGSSHLQPQLEISTSSAAQHAIVRILPLFRAKDHIGHLPPK
jgi:hypothetical protein